MAKFTSTEGECTDVLVHHKLVGISVFDGSFTCDWNLELYAVACRIKAAHGSAISDGFRMWISRVEPGLIVRNFNESLREAFSLNSTSPFLVCDEAGKRYEVTVYYDFEPLDVRFPLLNIQLGNYASMGGDGQALSNKRRILEKSRAFLTPEELRKGDEEPSDAVQSRKQLKILQWTHCALSLEPLETPVVFDLRGRLYSKKSVLDSIMEKQSPSKQGDESKSADIKITKLSDVCEVSNVEDGVGGKVSIRCPLTGYDAAAGVRDFVGFWGCGHVCWAASNRSGMERSTVDEPPSATSGERSPECPCCGEVSFAVPLVLKSESDEVKQFRRLRPLQRAFRKRKRSDQ